MISLNPEELDRLAQSREFAQLLKEVETANPRFRDISTDQKRIALGLTMLGRTREIPDLTEKYFRRTIPPIEKFLTRDYIGDDASILFDKWKKDLCEIFAPNSVILRWGVTGAIGTGKSTAGLIAQLYNVYRINSLRNPQLNLGTGPSKPMILQLFTVTKEKAQTTLIERVGILLSACKDYRKVNHIKEFGDYINSPLTPWVFTGEGYEFPNNIKIYAGSQDRHVLGEDVFGGLLDEAEFRIGSKGLVDKAFVLYDNIFERIRSRFLGIQYTLMCLLSSIAHEKGVMATHIAQLRNDPTGKVSQYSIWDTKYPGALEHDGHFWVIRGTQRHPSRVLDKEEDAAADKGCFELPPSCTLVKVPKRYQADFTRRTEQSLMNLAGQASMGQEVPFDDLTKIEDPNLCPVLHISAPLGNANQTVPAPLRDQLPRNLFVQTPEGQRFKRYPAATRYAHYDGAAVSAAGLAIVHKELSQTGKVFYVADLILKITSPNRINLEAIKEFVIDLRDYYGLGFKAFTADQYQSEQLLQKLTSIGYAEITEVLSVEKTRNPYDTLSNIVAQDCLKTGMMRDLKRELEGIYFENNKVFKQHIEGSHCDMADALCGACFNAVQSLYDTPSNIYEAFGTIRHTLDLLESDYQRIL